MHGQPTLFDLLRERGWKPHPVLSPIAATWCDLDELSKAAGVDVRVKLRRPTESDPWPKAEAVLAAPLTFNTINKWAGGHNDTLALGLLNELLGERLPIVAAPCAKAVGRSHPAYAASCKRLAKCGVTFLDQDETVVRDAAGTANLDWIKLVTVLDGEVSPPSKRNSVVGAVQGPITAKLTSKLAAKFAAKLAVKFAVKFAAQLTSKLAAKFAAKLAEMFGAILSEKHAEKFFRARIYRSAKGV